MKKILASLFFCASFNAAHAASPHVTWEGVAFVTDASPVCVQKGIDALGDSFRVIFAPRAFSQNGVDTLSIVDEKNFLLIRAASQNGFLNGAPTVLLPYKGRVIDNHAFTADFKSTSTFAISPAKPGASDLLVTITAVINNAWNVKKCNLRFDSINLTKRPD